MILIKEKEGFATHYYHLDELYKGPLLEVKSQSQEPVKLIKAPKPKKNQENINRYTWESCANKTFNYLYSFKDNNKI